MTADARPIFRQPRRLDRAIHDEAWIVDFLEQEPVGVLAFQGDEGLKALPNLFVFEASTCSVCLHAARSGETRRCLEQRPGVAFTVARMGRLLPASAAVDFSVEYASVVLEGKISIVNEEAAATRALELLMKKYAPHLEPGRDYRGVEPRDLARTSVYRIEIETWSAKGKDTEARDAYTYAVAKGHPRSYA